MATYQDGNIRKATPNTVTAMKRSAESRRCPACDRKSAMGREIVNDGAGVYSRERTCRYCGYRFESHTHREDGRMVVTWIKVWPDGRREETVH